VTAAQYRKACATLGISIYASAKALSISLRTAQYYAAGGKPIPEHIAKLLRAMIRLGTIDI
jgi:hypothetical protein